MTDKFMEFAEKFRLATNTIHTSDHWTLSLRPTQPTLGSCVISLNRYCERLSDISVSEAIDLSTTVKFTETRLRTAFGYDKINYLMLMMVDPHLHFHVIPRYADQRTYLDRVWVDKNWPTAPDIGGDEIDQSVADAIVGLLASAGAADIQAS